MEVDWYLTLNDLWLVSISGNVHKSESVLLVLLDWFGTGSEKVFLVIVCCMSPPLLCLGACQKKEFQEPLAIPATPLGKRLNSANLLLLILLYLWASSARSLIS